MGAPCDTDEGGNATTTRDPNEIDVVIGPSLIGV